MAMILLHLLDDLDPWFGFRSMVWVEGARGFRNRVESNRGKVQGKLVIGEGRVNQWCGGPTD